MTTAFDRPWMTALEMQFAALQQVREFFRRFNTARERGELYDATAEERYRETTDDIIAMLSRAQAFAWSGESARAVRLASRTLPGDMTWEPEMLLASEGWWWFDDHPFADLTALAYRRSPKDGSLNLTMFGTDVEPDGRVPLALATIYWPARESLTALVTREETGERRLAGIDAHGRISETSATFDGVAFMARFFLAASLWLHQRIVVMSSGAIERHRRKQLAREYQAPPPSDVKVIRLRRVESGPRLATDATTVDWSCRWIVNGHWRNQPYKDRRELIFISPYLKGPDEKPLRIPTHTVYQVDR